MTSGPDALARRLAELRESFDRGFAVAATQAPDKSKDSQFLIVGLGPERYAMRLADLLGLEANRKIVPLPMNRSGPPGLLGLAGFRGQLVAVFSLGQLLGSADGSATPRWLAICRGEGSGGLRVSRDEGRVSDQVQDGPGALPYSTLDTRHSTLDSPAALALAFDSFHGSVRVREEDICEMASAGEMAQAGGTAAPAGAKPSRAYRARQMVRVGSSMLYVVDIPAVAAACGPFKAT